VSGKGAAAAMAAAVLIGASELHDRDSACELLHHLNGVLRRVRIGGFATCLCADVGADGNISIANAGHLPPYCRGNEIQIDSGLPLGISADTIYAETALKLEADETLTFLSDGVVEARNGAGELFGFERAARISAEPAEKVAQTAREFGQEDDITVLTLTFSPVGVAHA
jgi:serine phosphatase RsbU (regulator of sigma subunit)